MESLKATSFTMDQSNVSFSASTSGMATLEASSNAPVNNNPFIVGTPAVAGSSFCPISTICKFPYKYVRDKNKSERISKAYFADGKFWRRTWNLYYAWPRREVSGRPLILVPAGQVDNFLCEINQGIPGAGLSLTETNKHAEIVLTFNSAHVHLRPKFLGFSTSQDQFKNAEAITPSPTYLPQGTMVANGSPAEDEEDQFYHTLELGSISSKGKKSGNRKTGRSARSDAKTRDLTQDLRQLERFLGLRPSSIAASHPPDETWEEWVARDSATQAAKNPPPIDVGNPPPYPFGSEVIFICIDVESWERDKRKITEIGVSTLDTLDLTGLRPGEDGKNWRERIHSRHFRIRENAHLENTDFVIGCAANFQFGASEFIAHQDVLEVVASCFRPPYHRLGGSDEAAQRTIVLVGHAINNDVEYLTQLGYSVHNLKHLHPSSGIIDTQGLYRIINGAKHQAALSTLLNDLNITPWGLHNAGNDAAYTMQAALGIAVRSAIGRPESLGTGRLLQIM